VESSIQFPVHEGPIREAFTNLRNLKLSEFLHPDLLTKTGISNDSTILSFLNQQNSRKETSFSYIETLNIMKNNFYDESNTYSFNDLPNDSLN